MISPKHDIASIVTAINAMGGNVTAAAKVLGYSSAKVIYYLKTKYPEIQEAIVHARNETIDTAEGKLKEAVEAGEQWAVLFALRTLGRHRGYVERAEVDHGLLANIYSDPRINGNSTGLVGRDHDRSSGIPKRTDD